MLNTRLLKAFIDGFYGYGNYDAKYWFVGMEESIGKSNLQEIKKKIEKRLKVWKKRGRKELEDLRGFQLALKPEDKHFKKRNNHKVALQRTWRKLIRVLYGVEGKKPNHDEMRKYQTSRLGRKKGDSCLVELLPLPARNRGHWPYNKLSRISWLENRGVYEKQVRPIRIKHLKRKVEKHKPKAVVLYGKANWKYYQEIAGVEFRSKEIDGIKVKYGKSKHTFFVLTLHPTASGVTNDYFCEIGRLISKNVKGP
jgi:hypothetical protein